MKRDLGSAPPGRPAQWFRAVPLFFLVAAGLYIFGGLFFFLVDGLPPGTREGAILTAWFSLIAAIVLSGLGLYFLPSWIRARGKD
ncbi:MAG: hypothetical protein ACE5NC_06890 [Anaerolineae bacterium]